MRILVTGANGQVGHALLQALAKKHPPQSPFAGEGGRKQHLLPEEGGRRAAPGGSALPACHIIPATRDGECDSLLPPGEGAGVRVRACETVDLANLDALPRALDRIAPDLILNAAAYTAVDRAEDEPWLAQRVNGDAVGVLGTWAARHGARVVHYSTDYVFDGKASQPYRETDPTHPVSVYGRSKLAGEIALRESGARHLIFRTAWVYAARGKNFLLTMLRLGAERDALRVVDDQVGAPTPARLIAETTLQVVAQWCAPPSAGRGSMRSIAGMSTPDGVYHLVASGQTSWCGFARAIFERAQRAGLIARAPMVHAIGTADYPTKAVRPAFSVLDTTRLQQAFGIALPDWQVALDGVIAELRKAIPLDPPSCGRGK
ncbi:MAG: dTDP-4-dehydrorhamnose reductase [Rhodanobacteraceae bacterium]